MPLELLIIPGIVFLLIGFFNGKKACKKINP